MSSAYERLSIQDQSNLWAEAPDTPMHIVAVLQVEPGPFVAVGGRLKLDEIRRRIARRLDRAPRLRQVVRPGSLLTGPPVGTRHNIPNTGGDALKLFTVYAPAQHAAGTIHKTKADAMRDEADVPSAR